MRTELGEGLTPFCQTTLSWDKDKIEGVMQEEEQDDGTRVVGRNHLQ